MFFWRSAAHATQTQQTNFPRLHLDLRSQHSSGFAPTPQTTHSQGHENKYYVNELYTRSVVWKEFLSE